MRLAARSVFTTERRLGPGSVTGIGSRGKYRSITELAGEPHVVRSELVGAAPADLSPQSEAIACMAHLTDLHVTDAQSPARFEFVNREWGDPRVVELLTMQRPQETLNSHAIDAMVRTINRVDGGPLTGAPVQMVVMTGDAIDNTQHNELMSFFALMNGGAVQPDSGAPGYEGVQLASWPVDIYWKPDGPTDTDLFQSKFGFPAHPGLLTRAMERFQAEGLQAPWLSCYGNHEQLSQGVGMVTPALADAMLGSRKPIALPPGFDLNQAVEIFVKSPERFMAGDAIDVAPDPERRTISRTEFGSTRYGHEMGAVRFITLDTVCYTGGAEGSIDAPQLRWLEEQLSECLDQYVVILSHHGYDELSNPRGERRADQLLELLLRHQNVVLWLNGHIHANRITPRGNGGDKHGFWEVTTSSIVDWPCQARVVEIFRAGDGLLAIACAMLDHEGGGLAGLHRELAANVPSRGFGSGREGTAVDRNVELLLTDPF